MKTKYLPRAWQINSKKIYEGNYYKYKKRNRKKEKSVRLHACGQCIPHAGGCSNTFACELGRSKSINLYYKDSKQLKLACIKISLPTHFTNHHI